MKKKEDGCALLLGERKAGRKKNHQRQIVYQPPPRAAP
jgi:hypothetical protein